MMKSLLCRILTTCLFASTALCASACGGGGDGANGGTQYLSIVSGGQQGLYYPSAIQFSNIISEALPAVKVNVETSGGSVANARLLGQGEADMATMQNDIAYYANRGEGMFEAPIGNLRGLTAMYPEVVQIVARRDSGISSVADLRGRKVSLGAPGSGTEMNAVQILDAYGLTTDDLGLVERLKDTEASDKMKDGHIEAAFFTYGLNAPVIMDMAVTTNIVVVSLDSDKIDALTSRYPYYTPNEVPAGTYEGQDLTARTVSVMAWLVATAEVPDLIAYRIVESLYNSVDVLHGPASPDRLKAMTLESALAGLSIDLHPGAEKFYTEKGIAP
jgi:hypothetical protein